jgi:small conductance mechanosensitive channel
MNISVFNILNTLKEWLFEHGPKVILIIIITWVLLKFMNKILDKIIRKAIPQGSFSSVDEEKKREDTLIKISQNFFSILVWIVAIVAIVSEFGIPVAPLITGAGILGVAVGFGSQSLVKDIITGLFIIAENQYRIGDFVCIGDYCGTVEDMTLRVTKLRNFDGTIYYIPNSEIKIASNKSKDYSKVNFTIGVGYDTDIDKLEEIINKVGDDLSKDEKYSDFILEAPHFLRIDDFGDYSINIRIIGKVKPSKQFIVTGEMRHRLKKIFEEKGIEIPYPTRVIRNM